MVYIPAYALSVSHENFPELRRRWASGRSEAVRYVRPFDPVAEPPAMSGRVVCVNESGNIVNSLPVYFPHGVACARERIFITTPWHIVSATCQLRDARVVGSEPSFNLLHTLRLCRDGSWLAASTGADLVVELSDSFTETGKWCGDRYWTAPGSAIKASALANGDFRGWNFPTEMHATHLSSAIESDNARWLVSLFHQGLIISVCPCRGDFTVLLEGLLHPHALRRVRAGVISLADTGRGLAIEVDVSHGRGRVITSVSAATDWLQDAYFGEDFVLLVDGARSRVLACDRTGRIWRIDQFCEAWRLQELCPLQVV